VKKLFGVGLALALAGSLAIPQMAAAKPAAAVGEILPSVVEHGQARVLSHKLASIMDARYGSMRLLANGDGNACRDNTVINNISTIGKVNACVGQVQVPGGYRLYHFAFARCGKNPSEGGGYWPDCNFGMHLWRLWESGAPGGPTISSGHASHLHSGTFTLRTSAVPGPGPGPDVAYQSITQSDATDSRGFELRNNDTGQFWTGREYQSAFYFGYPGPGA
jgi:hypothetical protein